MLTEIIIISSKQCKKRIFFLSELMRSKNTQHNNTSTVFVYSCFVAEEDDEDEVKTTNLNILKHCKLFMLMAVTWPLQELTPKKTRTRTLKIAQAET